MAELGALLAEMTPDQLEAFALQLPADDRRILEQVMAGVYGRGWRADPATMAAHLDASYRRWVYVDLLARQFRKAVEGESKRQIWNLPARLGKSLLASQWGPLWALDFTEGRARIILWSYGKALAVENAVGIRDRIQLYADHLDPGVLLAPGRKRMDRFVTRGGGGVVAAGVHGAVRGFGAGAGGGIVADDPFKDWQEAHSENRRNQVWNQYRGTLLDRLDDEGAWIIHVHHRVHEDDMTGRLLDEMEAGTGEVWDHVVIPALAVEGDVLGREVGEPIVPERFSVAFIRGQRRAMGSYLFSALQQQDPTPEEGTDIKRAWFLLYETPPLAPDASCTSWDLKLKDKEAGDYVVGQVWWRTGPDFWLRDQLRGQWDHATTANAIALLAVRHPQVQAHVIETAGSWDDVAPLLRRPQPGYEVTPDMAGALGMTETERAAVEQLRRRGLSGIIGNPPQGDKRVRARTYIVPTAEAGNVHLPAYAEWLPHLMDELAGFPNATHDDQVDAMSQGIKRLGVGEASIGAAQGAVPSPRPGAHRTAAPQPQAGGQRNASVVAPGRAQLPGPHRR